jgi:hypothetical protein
MKIFVLAFGLLTLTLPANALDENVELRRHEAVVTAIEPEHKAVHFRVTPKNPRKYPSGLKAYLRVSDVCVFYLTPHRPKRQASFAALRVGQAVQLSGYTSLSSRVATEVLIHEPQPK